VIKQSMAAVPTDFDERGGDRLAVEATSALSGIAPRNTKEGMLAAQMIAAHNVAMEQLRRAQLLSQPPEMAQARMNAALRLMRLFLDQVETLARLQGSLVQQKVVVEHVNVEATRSWARWREGVQRDNARRTLCVCEASWRQNSKRPTVPRTGHEERPLQNARWSFDRTANA
jgi:hypothetical protein